MPHGVGSPCLWNACGKFGYITKQLTTNIYNMHKHPSADYPASLDAIAQKRSRRPSADGLKAFFNRYLYLSPHQTPNSQQKVKTDETIQQETASFGKAVKYFNEPSDIRPGSSLSSVQGYRPSMEDKHVIATFHGAELFGVFDGHGGKDVAIYVSDNLPQALLPKFLNKERGEGADDYELEKTVRGVYRELDRTMCENGFEAGSCALVSIFDAVKKEMFIINLGDSRALLFTDECQQLLQTLEKSPADKDEKARIENAEHMVIHRGVERIDGVLAVSRAFGDSEFKTPNVNSIKYSGSHGAVSVVPMFHHLKLKSGKSYFLILACDGLWTDGGIKKPFTNEEIMQLVALQGWTAKELTKEAIARGSGDNVTAMVIRFDL